MHTGLAIRMGHEVIATTNLLCTCFAFLVAAPRYLNRVMFASSLEVLALVLLLMVQL
jgi:hypothetical protein